MNSPPEAIFILYLATTLDGYVAQADGSIDWLTSFDAHGEDNGYTAFYETIDALIMGSKTYEQILGFGDWPYPDKQSYVLTHHHLSSDRPDVACAQHLDTILDDIRQQEFRRVWIVGGGNVASFMINQGWVDEYVLTLMPIVLGAGISLFQDVPQQRLTLVKTTWRCRAALPNPARTLG